MFYYIRIEFLPNVFNEYVVDESLTIIYYIEEGYLRKNMWTVVCKNHCGFLYQLLDFPFNSDIVTFDEFHTIYPEIGY